MGLLQKYASDVLRHVVGGELAEGRFPRRQSGICHWFVFTSRKGEGHANLPQHVIFQLNTSECQWSFSQCNTSISRSSVVLLCTDVAAMGINTPGLNIGVSIGKLYISWTVDISIIRHASNNVEASTD